MPGIIITPGNFNPPSTPLETPGVITFSKVPDVTLNRRPQQSSRSRVTGFTPRLLPVNYTIWNPLGIAGAGPRLGSVANFRVRGTRYVPDGSYLDNVQANLGNGVDYYGEVFNEQFSPDYPEIPDIVGYYFESEQSGAWTNSIKRAYSVTVILDGCDDGASYEVYGRERENPTRRLLDNLGGGVWSSEFTSDFPILSRRTIGDPNPLTTPVISSIWESFELMRNGDIYDVVTIGMGFRNDITWTYADPWIPEDYRVAYVEAAPAVSVILYGPNADVTTVPSPDPINITVWQRESYATQGHLLFS